MAIQASDIKFYKSSVVSDESNNGGGKSANEVVTGVKNNLFPNVTHSERVAGVVRYRKEFVQNEESTGLTMQSTRVWIGRKTPADDYIEIKAGTDVDTQANATGYTQWAGAGVLNENITGGVTNSFDVVFDTSGSGVYNGSVVHVGDGTNEEFITLDSTAGVVWSGATATLTIAESGTVDHNYAQTVTIVATTVSLGNLVASFDNWAETNVHGGTYDESTYPIVTYNEGTVEDSFTITFTGAGAFSVSGTVTGSLGAGTTAVDFQPANGASYYFKLDKDGWSGTWTSGDSIDFDTHHAAGGLWVKETVPANTPSYSNNNPRIDVYGESS